MIKALLDFLLHVDKNLLEIVKEYGTASYLILFGIVFAETGFVITPFLPGDSLLFAAGALSAVDSLDLFILCGSLIIAAFIGNTINYFIGKKFGTFFIESNKIPFFKKEYVEKGTEFYVKHGVKAILFSRFVPIFRTFVPFVAGMAKMPTGTFILWTAISAVLWVIPITLCGYFFGNIPVIKNNFSLVVLGIVAVSLLPSVYAGISTYLQKRKTV